MMMAIRTMDMAVVKFFMRSRTDSRNNAGKHQGLTRQRMIAVDDDVLSLNLLDGVEGVII